MKTGSRELFGDSGSFPIVFVTAVLAYAIHQYVMAPTFFSTLQVHDNDDAMRLLSVRSLLAGQGWFDMVQNRVLPPDGVSLHWSRFIDAGIAGMNILFSQIAGPQMAERLAAAAWPALLFGLYLTLVGRTTRAVFGTSAAGFAMIAVAAMQPLTSSYFPFGRVDHHNVQLLCMAAICAGLIVRGDPLIRGALAGGAAAFSLAVGLETIVFVAVAGLILTLSHTAGRAGAGHRLLGFGVTMGVAAPLLFAAQTAPAAWAQPQCDALSPPFLALTSGAALACLAMVVAGRALHPGWTRLLLATGLAGFLFYLTYPMLAPCLNGPYADLPEAVQAVVIGNIIEALPAHRLLDNAPGLALQVLLPLYLMTAVTVGLLIRGRVTGRRVRGTRALRVVAVFLCLGTAASFLQARGFLMGLAVLPMAFGAVFAPMANGDWTRSGAVKLLACLGFAVAVLVPHVLILGADTARAVIRDAPEDTARPVYKADAACNGRDQMDKLNTLPASVIMAPLNLGTQILLYTDHAVTSVPYHRSVAALENGVLPFLGDGGEMKATVQAHAADYVLVCAGQVYGPERGIGSRLAQGEVPGWLQPVDIGDGPIRVFRVPRDADGNLSEPGGARQ